MGISTHAIKLIAGKIKNARVLSLGYPDILIKDLSDLPYEVELVRSRMERHGGGSIPDTDEFFEKLGAKSVDYIDVSQFHGVERIVDLNNPGDLGKYDLIIDPGTLEHCFNVGVAWMAIANALDVGGTIYHNNPVNMLNHGFWNFSPTVYHDFYTQNGFDFKFYLQKNGTLFNAKNITARMKFDSECMSHVIATRKTDQPLKFPIQTKYL